MELPFHKDNFRIVINYRAQKPLEAWKSEVSQTMYLENNSQWMEGYATLNS